MTSRIYIDATAGPVYIWDYLVIQSKIIIMNKMWLYSLYMGLYMGPVYNQSKALMN